MCHCDAVYPKKHMKYVSYDIFGKITKHTQLQYRYWIEIQGKFQNVMTFSRNGVIKLKTSKFGGIRA